VHVTPTELRVVNRGDLLLRFALLDRAAYVLAEVPSTGSAGSSLEEACAEGHWAIVLRGQLELEYDGDSRLLPAGTLFHVPEGPPEHRFRAAERTVFAGFVPIERIGAAYPDSQLDVAEPSDPLVEGSPPASVTMMPGLGTVQAGLGRVEAEAALMGPWVACRATFGKTSGYGSSWCDLPHWGMVLTGGATIEWEHDVEILTAGDAYYCPAGPPGHHIEVADAATIVDFTPRDAYATTDRVAEWRPRIPILEAAAAATADAPH
jgi:quercetin dioxygenase-like cupin family protein